MNTQTDKPGTAAMEEIELDIEELEEVIAPGITRNHNETLEVDLTIEGDGRSHDAGL